MPRSRSLAVAGGIALVAVGVVWLIASGSHVVTTASHIDHSLTGPGLGSALGAAGQTWLWRAGEVAPTALGVVVLARRRAGWPVAVLAGALAGSLVAAAGVVAREASSYASLQNQTGAAVAPAVADAYATGPAVAWVVAAAAVGALGALAVTVAWATRRA